MLTTNILLAEKYDYLSEKIPILPLCRLEMYRLTGTKCMRMCRVILQWMLQIVRLKVIKNTSMYNM